MPILISLFWCAVSASLVHFLLVREQNRRLASADDAEVASGFSGSDPSFAAVITFLFGITGPYFLFRSRGIRGLFEGVGILLLAMVGIIATEIGLALLLRATGHL